MGQRGPAPASVVNLFREGNPGHKTKDELASVMMPPAEHFPEPNWSRIFTEAAAPKRPAEPQREIDERVEHYMQRIYRWEKKLAAYELKRKAINGARWCKLRASDEWRRVVPILQASVGLSDVDYSLVVDYCVCVARLERCERDLSHDGHLVMGMRGASKSPMVTVAKNYRGQLRTYIQQLGLSPAARVGIPSKPVMPSGSSEMDGDDGLD